MIVVRLHYPMMKTLGILNPCNQMKTLSSMPFLMILLAILNRPILCLISLRKILRLRTYILRIRLLFLPVTLLQFHLLSLQFHHSRPHRLGRPLLFHLLQLHPHSHHLGHHLHPGLCIQWHLYRQLCRCWP